MPDYHSDYEGMTTHFYVAPESIHGPRMALPEAEARHAVRVLRMKVGDELIAVDGEGGWYRIELDHVGRSEAAGHIVERQAGVGEPPYRFTMAAGLIKHRDRFETLLEKAVELGVTEIVPLITARTEKARLREDRAENILIAAMKQCGRSRLPVLRKPTSIGELLERPFDLGLCCHEGTDADAPLLDALARDVRPDAITALIGPEGGFTDAEVASARSAGFRVVSLGGRRLRAETAALAAAACISGVYDAR
jgi:16S rRNA (uracil1498-N3)-methyltransferase